MLMYAMHFNTIPHNHVASQIRLVLESFSFLRGNSYSLDRLVILVELKMFSPRTCSLILEQSGPGP